MSTMWYIIEDCRTGEMFTAKGAGWTTDRDLARKFDSFRSAAKTLRTITNRANPTRVTYIHI